MKRFIITLTAILSFSAMGQAQQINKYRLNVGKFDKVQVADNVNVRYLCNPDSAGFIAFEGEEEFANAFIFLNKKGKLKIEVNKEDLGNERLPELRIYSDFLLEAENGSTFTLTIESPSMTPSLELKQVGNGKIIANNIKTNDLSATVATGKGTIVINGTSTIANYKMIGMGTIQADNLDATEVKCTILGGGSIGCSATKLLDIRGIGSTKVYYKGRPEVKKVGGGTAIPMTGIEKSE